MSPVRRPPRLDETTAAEADAPVPPSFEQRCERARLVGRGTGLGPTELRRLIARIAEGDPRALGGLDRLAAVSEDEVAVSIRAGFGASPARPEIDPAALTRGVRDVAAAIVSAARRGGTVVAATARPASLLPLQRGIAALAASAGASVVSLPDSSELRVDGRRGRRLRWVDGVACVTDGQHLFATDRADAADELLFSVPRAGLVVADGAFAAAAVGAGAPVVATVGLEHAALAVAARRRGDVVVLPLPPDRPPAAYDVVLERLAANVADLLATAPPPGDAGASPAHDPT